MKHRHPWTAIVLLLVLLIAGKGEAFTIDFEGLADLTAVTNQYSSFGVEFSNATILTAGISLNEFEFPPHSGQNVVFDDGGSVAVHFIVPISHFGAYFTYLAPLTLSFFDITDTLVGTVGSTFLSNLALSGDPGSSPNEFLGFASGAGLGLGRVVIAGDPLGGSFTMDDLTANPLNPVPEPSTVLLMGAGIAALAAWRQRKGRQA